MVSKGRQAKSRRECAHADSVFDRIKLEISLFLSHWLTVTATCRFRSVANGAWRVKSSRATKFRVTKINSGS